MTTTTGGKGWLERHEKAAYWVGGVVMVSAVAAILLYFWFTGEATPPASMG
jgi:Mg2+ and Co2+ transporter CorA